MSSSWPPRNVLALRQNIESLADWHRAPPKDRTDEEKIWLVRFFVVRTCGYLEQAIYECARAYIEGKSGGPIRTFSHSWIARTRNPSPENVLDLAGRFGGGFEKSLRELLDQDDQRLYRELAFLVNRRHQIAHGLNEGLTGQKALVLYECVLEVAEWFFVNMNPNNSRIVK